MADAIAAKQCGCVIFIDLNRLKPINDAMGHAVGGKILSSLAERLNRLSSEKVDVVRFGGDKFILLIKKLPINYQNIIELTIKDINQLLPVSLMTSVRVTHH